ncbi:hypothetical protein IW262DRAFT_362431 [Armillaria fumosa]|nr:hypothetical protein IW262DRAFT_362431 [Armillaria fumosa]
MAGHRSPPASSTTGVNQASTSGTPSAHPPGIFQEPNPHINDGSRRSQPTPHSHLPPQQYGEGPPQHANPPHPHFHRPPQPMPGNPLYDVTQALPPWSPAHPDYENFVRFYQRQPLNAPSSGAYVHQGGEAPPPQGLVPQHLPPHGPSTGFFPLLQGYLTPHDYPHSQAGSSSQFPVAPSRRGHDVPMPHLTYPQVNQSHQEAPASYYALGPPQYHPQDQNDPPYVPPHMRPSEALDPVKMNKKRKAPDYDEPAPKQSTENGVSSPQSQAQPLKRKRGRPPKNKQNAQDSGEPVPTESAPNKSAPEKSTKSEVSSPQSQDTPPPKRKPGRPTNAERDANLKRTELEKQKAANAQSDATNRGSSHQEPIASTAPRQEPRTPAPRQTGIPGNPQVSTTIPQSATSADAREHQRSAVPLWATNLPEAFYDFINRYPPLNSNQNDTDPISTLIPSAWLDLSNYPPIDDPSWPSVNSLTRLTQIDFLPPPSQLTTTKSNDEVGQDGLSILIQARDLGKRS